MAVKKKPRSGGQDALRDIVQNPAYRAQQPPLPITPVNGPITAAPDFGYGLMDPYRPTWPGIPWANLAAPGVPQGGSGGSGVPDGAGNAADRIYPESGGYVSMDYWPNDRSPVFNHAGPSLTESIDRYVGNDHSQEFGDNPVPYEDYEKWSNYADKSDKVVWPLRAAGFIPGPVGMGASVLGAGNWLGNKLWGQGAIDRRDRRDFYSPADVPKSEINQFIDSVPTTPDMPNIVQQDGKLPVKKLPGVNPYGPQFDINNNEWIHSDEDKWWARDQWDPRNSPTGMGGASAGLGTNWFGNYGMGGGGTGVVTMEEGYWGS